MSTSFYIQNLQENDKMNIDLTLVARNLHYSVWKESGTGNLWWEVADEEVHEVLNEDEHEDISVSELLTDMFMTFGVEITKFKVGGHGPDDELVHKSFSEEE
ncbi:hypothetical protein CYMTET_53025 [Cymbomonas tetramitiformis]|uniref:Uncharacterized protein n=1 Tax=Cymbomonas tetramitiformis TaxID=36881 RepID=A0AAE0ES57_9CHLO|nr:hypothetical protein CYMTET_53025 [Cymbomonas tetramitiformis]